MSCDFHEPYFGASYPDACCIDGYLWDLDSCHEPGGPLYSGGDVPCPQCNHEAWINSFEDEFLNDGYVAREKNLPREFTPEKIRHEQPADSEKIKSWWLQGYDEAAIQLAKEVGAV